MRDEIIKDFGQYTDRELLELTAADGSGNSLPFRELYGRYSKQVYIYCVHNHFNKELAQNVYQEAWISLFENVQSGTVINNVTAFLITVCRRRIIDDIRRERSKPQFVELEAAENVGYDDNNDLPDTVRTINEAINLLDEKSKELFVMYYMSDLKIKEIASITGDNYDAVKKRIYRANLKVKEFTLKLLNQD